MEGFALPDGTGQLRHVSTEPPEKSVGKMRRKRSNSEGSPLRRSRTAGPDPVRAAVAPQAAFTPHMVKTDAKGVVSFVNSDFLRFTGFSYSEFVGKKCDFLQGDQTDPEDVQQLSRAVGRGTSASVVILNYTKGGTPFWNILRIQPEREGDSTMFVGDIISLPVPERLRENPRLCFDDALALMRVFSTVPSSLGTPLEFLRDLSPSALSLENGSEEDETSGDAPAPSDQASGGERTVENEMYHHVDYASRFPSAATGAALGGAPDVAERPPLRFIAETSLPTDKGRFRVRAYRDLQTGAEPLAMIVGDVEGGVAVPCRVHDQCVTSEVFGSLRCDCKQQLNYALNFMQSNEYGMVLYLPQEGRGIGLANKVAAYALQESGLDTVDANRHLGLPDDARSYEAVLDILSRDLNVVSIKLMTNNPRKIRCLEALGISVVDRLPCVCEPTSDFSRDYVKAKVARMGHMIDPAGLG